MKGNHFKMKLQFSHSVYSTNKELFQELRKRISFKFYDLVEEESVVLPNRLKVKTYSGKLPDGFTLTELFDFSEYVDPEKMKKSFLRRLNKGFESFAMEFISHRMKPLYSERVLLRDTVISESGEIRTYSFKSNSNIIEEGLYELIKMREKARYEGLIGVNRGIQYLQELQAKGMDKLPQSIVLVYPDWIEVKDLSDINSLEYVFSI